MFNTMLTKAPYWPLPRVRCGQSTSSHDRKFYRKVKNSGMGDKKLKLRATDIYSLSMLIQWSHGFKFFCLGHNVFVIKEDLQ
jgi:hypothetical protein